MEALERLAATIENGLRGRGPEPDRDDNLWDAAVLLPLVNTPDGISVLFEVRAAKLGWQPGDVCFPGGRAECSDDSFAATALRETCEELGLGVEDVQLIGGLNYLVTHMGPIIHPYVGCIKYINKINFNKDEVDEIFTVPLAFLLNNPPRVAHMELANKAGEDFPFDLLPRQPREWRKRKGYSVYFYEYGGHVIWGLTARILHGFLNRFAAQLKAALEGEASC